MICAVIAHMEKHLPQNKILVFSLGKRFFEQPIIPQVGQISAHVLLDVVPVGAKDFPIVKFEPDRLQAYNPAAASLAWSRTLAFLQRAPSSE